MTTANTTKTKTARFSIEEYILDRVTSPEVAAQMAQAVDFAALNLVRSRARAVVTAVEKADQGMTSHLLRAKFKAANPDEPIVVEQELLVDLENIIREVAQGGDFMNDAGHEPGAIQQLLQAVEVRERWGEIATALTGMTTDFRGNPRSYRSKSLEEAVSEVYQFELSATENSRIKLAVTKEANRKGLGLEATNELFKKRFDQRKAVIEAQNRDRALLAEFDSLVFGLVMQAGSAVKNSPLPTAFWELPAEVRSSFIEAAIRGARRAESFATSDRNLTEDQFSLIVEECARIETQLEAVLGSARGTLTTAADIQARREALRAKLDI